MLASDSAAFGAATEVAALRMWQATALSLAVVGAVVLAGVGAVVAVLVLAR